jgi:hypothetical protein
MDGCAKAQAETKLKRRPMNTLQAHHVYYQPADIPADLHIWQDENSGIAALTEAARDIVEGKTATFALCRREGTLPPTIDEIVKIAMGYGGDPAEGYNARMPRFCGEDDDPDGPGSHQLHTYENDAASIAVCMALTFKSRGQLYFRLR